MSGITRRILLSAAMVTPVASLAQTSAPPGAYLYFIWPNDGERIEGAFWCRFGLRNMGISRAGDTTPGVGHHHLLIDVKRTIQSRRTNSLGQEAPAFWRRPNRGADRVAAG
jgi:hypothetical protein